MDDIILPELGLNPTLPVSEGAMFGFYLATAVEVVVPSPKLPKLVKENWPWEVDEHGVARTNNIIVAISASWVNARAKERNIGAADAFFDILFICGLTKKGAEEGLLKGMKRVSKLQAYATMTLLWHDGKGYEVDGDHPQVLIIKRRVKKDIPLLAVKGEGIGTFGKLNETPDVLSS
jgi:hypothetical protein